MSNYPYGSQPQPAWIDGRTAETAERERTFIRSVYGWMFGGLLITSGAALWVLKSAAMQQLIFGSRIVFWGLMLAELGLVLFLSARVTKMSAGAAAASFLVYSLLSGLTLSSIFLVYTRGSIVNAFVTAGGMFAAMSVYGLVTKRDLTSWGAFFGMGLIGVLICMVVNIFLQSSMLSFAASLIGVVVFVGLTAYDTQTLKAYAHSPELRENLAVFGALRLYLDFVNLFLMLLRLFGGNRR
ncbi:MAG TPA: Bax inhibitor-1/YccA family protein [Thermoanaerobaculia bacterium]|nr:Bax inhibitor-1/YccA family protein [Thermoanaerobaculia bacterium]